MFLKGWEPLSFLPQMRRSLVVSLKCRWWFPASWLCQHPYIKIYIRKKSTWELAPSFAEPSASESSLLLPTLFKSSSSPPVFFFLLIDLFVWWCFFGWEFWDLDRLIIIIIGINLSTVLQFFLFCFVYLWLFIIFRSESWRCHFNSLLFDSYHCHTIDS